MAAKLPPGAVAVIEVSRPAYRLKAARQVLHRAPDHCLEITGLGESLQLDRAGLAAANVI